MNFYFLPTLMGVLMGVGFLLMRTNPSAVVAVIPGSAIILTFVLYGVSARRALSHVALFRLVFPAVFLVVGSGLFSTILNRTATYVVFSVLASLLVAWFVSVAIQYVRRSELYQPPALEMLSVTLNILSVFFVVSWLFGFVVFFGTSVWKIILPGAVAFALFFFHSLGSGGGEHEERLLVSGVVTLLASEALGVLSFLPFGYFTLSVVLMIVVLFLYGMGWAHLERRSTLRALKMYGGISLAGIVLTLMTTRWTP